MVVFLIIHFAGPEGEVISDELHNGGSILVAFFIDVFDVGDSVVEGLLGGDTGFGRVVHHFVAENGIVQAEPKTNGTGGSEVIIGNFDGSFISLLSLLLGVV